MKPPRETLTAKDHAKIREAVQALLFPVKDGLRKANKKLDKMCQDKKSQVNGN